MKVRVVEDHPDTLAIICAMLDDAGIPVAVRRPDLDVLRTDVWEDVTHALVDLNLQRDFTGFDVLRYMQKHVPHIKRIVISVWPGGFMETAAFVKEGLAHDVLTKPFTLEVMLRALGVENGV